MIIFIQFITHVVVLDLRLMPDLSKKALRMPCGKFSHVFDSVNSIKFMMVHLLLHKICHLNDKKEINSFENV